MYRANANLKMGKREVRRGQAFSRRDMAATIAGQLMAAGKIEVVAAPPLAEIPVMREHITALNAAGIEMCDAFVDTDPEILARAIGLDVGRVRALQEAICRTLDSPLPRG